MTPEDTKCECLYLFNLNYSEGSTHLPQNFNTYKSDKQKLILALIQKFSLTVLWSDDVSNSFFSHIILTVDGVSNPTYSYELSLMESSNINVI